MKVDTDMHAPGDDGTGAEAEGYDGIWSADTAHDPFLALAAAARETHRIDIGTGVAIAFARNPVTLAMAANDLQLMSGGRFILGLGSQVRAHIERRFSMPWSEPAARMGELIEAIRAVFSAWQTGDRLRFEGRFYHHTLMTPNFSPGPNPHGPPRIYLAAVGPRMARVAGEVADGLILHGFTTRAYLDEVLLPAFAAGLAASGRARSDVEICHHVFVISGAGEQERAACEQRVKERLGFYGSTPGYRRVLDQHGWGDLQQELNDFLRRSGRSGSPASLVPDQVAQAFAVVAEPADVADRYLDRFGHMADRVRFYEPYRPSPAEWRRAAEARVLNR